MSVWDTVVSQIWANRLPFVFAAVAVIVVVGKFVGNFLDGLEG